MHCSQWRLFIERNTPLTVRRSTLNWRLCNYVRDKSHSDIWEISSYVNVLWNSILRENISCLLLGCPLVTKFALLNLLSSADDAKSQYAASSLRNHRSMVKHNLNERISVLFQKLQKQLKMSRLIRRRWRHIQWSHSNITACLWPAHGNKSLIKIVEWVRIKQD